MELKELRIKIHPVLYKKYRMFCLEHNISVPKQTAELIRHFLDIQNINKEIEKEV